MEFIVHIMLSTDYSCSYNNTENNNDNSCYSNGSDSPYRHRAQLVQSYCQMAPRCTWSNRGSSDPRDSDPNDISIDSAVFAQFNRVTNRRTDTHTSLARPHAQEQLTSSTAACSAGDATNAFDTATTWT